MAPLRSHGGLERRGFLAAGHVPPHVGPNVKDLLHARPPILRHCLSVGRSCRICAVTPHPHVYLALGAGSIVNCW